MAYSFVSIPVAKAFVQTAVLLAPMSKYYAKSTVLFFATYHCYRHMSLYYLSPQSSWRGRNLYQQAYDHMTALLGGARSLYNSVVRPAQRYIERISNWLSTEIFSPLKNRLRPVVNKFRFYLRLYYTSEFYTNIIRPGLVRPSYLLLVAIPGLFAQLYFITVLNFILLMSSVVTNIYRKLSGFMRLPCSAMSMSAIYSKVVALLTGYTPGDISRRHSMENYVEGSMIPIPKEYKAEPTKQANSDSDHNTSMTLKIDGEVTSTTKSSSEV